MSGTGYLTSPAPHLSRSAVVARARMEAAQSPVLHGSRTRVRASQQSLHFQHNHNSSALLTAASALKCPELLLRGVDLQTKVPVEKLEKKGKRFESPWNQYYVAVYGGVLFYYDDLSDLPRGIVPLAGSVVKAVDRIFKNSDHAVEMEASAEECGPCFKITSSANRVLLFRCESEVSRNTWTRQILGVNLGASVATTTSQSSSATTASTQTTEPMVLTVGTAVGRLSSFSAQSTQSSRTPTSDSNSRLSLDETQHRRKGRHTPSNASDAAQETEISQMLRDAMVLVSKQKKEILELRKALEEARGIAAAAAQSTSLAPGHVAEAEEIVEAVAIPEPVVGRQVSDDSDVASLRPSTDSTASSSMMQGPPSSGSGDLTDTLQRQAMELAEIARYLQMTFQNDVFGASKQINSSNSSAPTEMLDHISTTSSNYSDQRSEVDESDDQDDSGSERLSEFVEADTKFLESNGMLDSIQKVMRDFMSPSNAPRKNKEEFIIDDDVIAEIRQNVVADRKRKELNLMDTSTLRALRSISSCDDVSDYKLSLSPQSVARTQSARTFSTDDFDTAEKRSSQRKRRPKRLDDLVVEDNMAIVSSILQTASREEKTLLLLPLVRLFNRHNRLSRLIRWAIESEVASVMNVATLFRSDDYASRLVSTYSKGVGSHFIKIILTEPIQAIAKLQLADVDLTPKLAHEVVDRDAIQQNADNLMDACQAILDSIIANKDSIPSSYFHICSHLNAKVINRFDGSMEGLAVEDPASLTRSVIGGFLFLRFVCPAITTPHLHDLLDKEPPSETRKILVLITKLLFKTATSVLFNEKEAHLRILNPFIERNSAAIQTLFADLAVAPAESIDECFAADSLHKFDDISPAQPELDLEVIRAVTEKNLPEIEKKLSVSGCSPQTVGSLHHALSSSKPNEKAQRGKKINIKFLSSFTKRVRKQSDV